VRARDHLAFTTLAACLVGACWGCTAGPIEIATLPPDSLGNDLVGHWAFDDGPGTVATDSSGNGRTGIVGGIIPSPGSPSPWIPGQFGLGYSFSGADYVTAGGIPRPTPSYSVTAWVQIQPGELGAPIANLLSTEALGGGWALYATLGLGQQESYAFRFATNPTQGYVVASCACVIAGPWTHLAAVVDGDASTLTLYVNGVATTVPTAGATILPGSTFLYMARSAELSPTFPLTGALDDVAIYDRALVAQEVSELSQEAVPNPQ
jgi:hypothetical protein